MKITGQSSNPLRETKNHSVWAKISFRPALKKQNKTESKKQSILMRWFSQEFIPYSKLKKREIFMAHS